MNATISDPRLPGTTATGKIVSYELKGEKGKFIGHVEIGCAVGYGGHVSADPGTPEYASSGYMQPGYQKYDGALIVVSETDGDINYTPPGNYPFDDGLVFPLTLRQVSDDGGIISGNLEDQAAAIKSGIGASQLEANESMNGINLIRQSATGQMSYDWTTYTVQQFNTPVSAAWALAESKRALSQWDVPRMMENNPITWTMELKNIQNGPFNGSYALHISMLEIKQGINLEASSSL
jgi:hypothetical protein